MGWKFILSLIFAVIIALFAIANAGSVRVNFIVAVYEVSQAIVILVSAFAGALVAGLLGLIKTLQMKMKLNQQEKRITELERDKEKSLKKYAELDLLYQELAVQAEQTEDCPEVSAQADNELSEDMEKRND